MGLCQNCKEWVIPDTMNDEVFCPICGQLFIDTKEQ